MRTAYVKSFGAALLIVALFPAVADAGCHGTLCGGACNVDPNQYRCTAVTDSYDTLACKEIAHSGCMSMNSLVCCPRIPRE